MKMPARIEAKIDLDRLRNNYSSLFLLSKRKRMIPMIKSNAYGHGALEVALTLKNEPQLEALGVATIEEAIALRKEKKLDTTRLLVFSDSCPWDENRAAIFRKYNLSVVLHRWSDFKSFIARNHHHSIDYHVQWNTGMNRLGIELENLAAFQRLLCSTRKRHQLPRGIFTHLAAAEAPEKRLSQHQLKKFQYLLSELKPRFPQALFHMANSAALWKSKEWKITSLTDAVRPGIALYGIPPEHKWPVKEVKPVMSLRSKCVQLHTLEKGEGLGYGFDYQAKKKQTIAILGCGYGDGVSRLLGNQSQVIYQRKRLSILGRVSMDLMAVESPVKKASSSFFDHCRFELFGDRLSIWEQALQAKTIPYEILTGLTSRIERTYVGK